MSERIISAVSGDQHVPVQAPEWDYANGQKVAFTAIAAASAVINSPLVRLISTQDCFYTVGDNPTAANALSCYKEQGISFLEMQAYSAREGYLTREQETGLTGTLRKFPMREPDISIGARCFAPFECDYRDYPAHEELELSTDKKSFFIQFQKSKITLSRLDKGGKKIVKKALPHIKPPEQKPEPLGKRTEFDHSWGFSARMPMPPEAIKKDKS